MKRNSTHIFIAFSSLALLAVLAIQVNWILQTAQIKEELFNEKANMVLSKTADGLAADTANHFNLSSPISREKTSEIDSLLAHYMDVYNIHLAYSFEAKPVSISHTNATFVSQSVIDPSGEFVACVGMDDQQSGLQLKLDFPKKEQYILAEMGTPFVTSVVLILVVLVLSWRTVYSLWKEKRISENTAEFLNNMTHEFNTPLTNISLAGKMLVKENNIGQEDKIRQYSGIILEENDKLRNQVEQVLSMSSLEKGEMPLRKTETDMHELIDYTIQHMRLPLENAEGEIKMDLKATNTLIFADKTHLGNALRNVMDNAIKYSNGKPEIYIRTYNVAKNITIEIADKGLGIEKEFHKEIFEKYFRIPTGDIHNVKGFGLGLSYVKKIIELHGGTVVLQSEKGKGSTFNITIPNFN